MKIYNKPELKKRRKELRKRETVEEVIIWEYLRNKTMLGIKFYRQFSIQYYIADFYSPRLKMVIEVDGDSHQSEYGIEYDEVRTDILNSLNIKVLRFSNKDVHDSIEKVIEKIKQESLRILDE